MDRAERAGFGIAVGGHILLFAVFAAGYLAVKPPPPMKRQPIEVSIVDEVGLESGAPEISNTPLAPKLGEVEAPVEPPAPAPVPTPSEARPAPQPRQAATPAPAPPKQPSSKAAQRPTAGRLKGLLEGLSDSDSDSRSTAPPGATVSPAVQSSLAAEVRRQLKPHWQPPSGADVEKLKTVLRINLARDGSVTSINFVTTNGINASNRTQADLHRERAIKAVRLASPFNLPPQFYDGWKSMTVNFDLRLSL
jgi:type IV secretory pathway VirB10-like protein